MKPIAIRLITLYPIAMSLVETLKTSSGDEPFKTGVIVKLETDAGIVGWGEASPEIAPGYNYETVGTALHIMSEFLVPALIGQTIQSATEVPALLARVRGHHMAKHALEAAVWDALAKTNEISLAQTFAGHLPKEHQSRGYANVGVSIGIKSSIEETLQVIEKRLEQGYGRIKLKIEPGWDVELARAVRKVYPSIVLMLDANSAYTLADADHLKQLDDLNLLMIEQPLGHDDIYEHSKLQPRLKTALCLDESICSADDLRLALNLGACRILNLKPARVSGYTESLKIYNICVEHNLPLWIGGLMETGVGRAANLAFASLPAVTLPCDISATDRYFDPDLTEPPFYLGANSRIAVPTAPGIGVEVDISRLEAAAQRWTSERVYKNYF